MTEDLSELVAKEEKRRRPRKVSVKPTEILPPDATRPYLSEASIVNQTFTTGLRQAEADADRLGAEIIQIQDTLLADIQALNDRADAEIKGRSQRRDDHLRIAAAYRAGLDAMTNGPLVNIEQAPFTEDEQMRQLMADKTP